MDIALPPPVCVSWDSSLSEYPEIPGILGRSWDHPWMDTALPPPLSEYPGIPGILRRSEDHPRMDTELAVSKYLNSGCAHWSLVYMYQMW